MTKEEFNNHRNHFLKRIDNELTPENCPFCGGMHVVSISRHDAMPIFRNMCCNDMIREVHRIQREVFGELEP